MSRFKKLWIETEQCDCNIDIYDDNTDVIVTMNDGTKWTASFFTYKNIESLRLKNQQTGENLNGLFLWSSNMILIEKIDRTLLERVISNLMEEGLFVQVFTRIEESKF
ncbi:hypothetical protein ACFPRA_19445 [Sporosarcina soli]|uniref:Uncharacterized protein n=1 Tax=Sporosarcina soli TaxID=334736 RepID=A0ABW0TRL7_9BACL